MSASGTTRRSVKQVLLAICAGTATVAAMAIAPTPAVADTGAMQVPASGKVTGIVGKYCSSGEAHGGTDLAGPEGTPIYAAYSGKVNFAGRTATGESESYGNYVTIDHPNSYRTIYAHLISYSVSPGQQVNKGQQIGKMGSTGNSTGTHLHFEVRRNNVRQDGLNEYFTCGATYTAGSPIGWSFPDLPSTSSITHSSPSAVTDPTTGRNVFYVAADGTLHQYTVNSAGNAWNDFQLGTTKVLPGTSPSAVYDPKTGRNVFYAATDGKLHQYSVKNGAWVDYNLQGNVKPGTSPSAVYDPQTGRNVFFVASNNRVNQYTPNTAGTGWNSFQLGGTSAIAVADGTSPSAVVDPQSGRNVFFNGADGKVHQYSVKGSTWSDYNLQGNFKPRTSPAAVVDPQTGRNVFFVASNGRINQYTVNPSGATWDLFQLGGSNAPAVAEGTSPSAVVDSSTGRNVFFVASDGKLHQFSVKGSTWSDYNLTGNVFPGSSPSAVVDSATGRNVFFVASNGRINQYTVNSTGSGWSVFQLGTTPTQ